MDVEQKDYERVMTQVRSQLGQQAFDAAWAEGRTMTPEQLLAVQEQFTIADQPEDAAYSLIYQLLIPVFSVLQNCM